MEKTQQTIGTASRPVSISIYRALDPRGVVIIAPAMGVLQSFYKDIALFLNQERYHVITFDYFAMTVRPTEPQVSANAIANFGTHDLDAVIRYARETFPDLKLFFLGHSIGGQIFPLAGHAGEIAAAVLVGSQQVSEHLWHGIHKLQVQLFWRLFVPVSVRCYGYLPGFVYGGKHGLQKAIAIDWARLARTSTGIFGESEMTRERYRSLKMPAAFFSLAGDNLLAPQAAVMALMNQYGSPVKSHRHLRLESARNPHFDFFRKHAQQHWSLVTDFLKDPVLATGGVMS